MLLWAAQEPPLFQGNISCTFFRCRRGRDRFARCSLLTLGRQLGVGKRPSKQVGEVQARGPFAQVDAIHGVSLHLENTEHIAPLAVRDAAALAIPIELGQDGVLGRGKVNLQWCFSGKVGTDARANCDRANSERQEI